MLALGLVALCVVVYVVRIWRSMRVASDDVEKLKTACGTNMLDTTALTSRVAKLETVLRIDGARAMAEANKNALPGFMR